MSRARTHVVFSLAILLACSASAFPLDPSLDISQYAHTSWKIRDGFLRGDIWSNLAQTADGYLWLGTEFGLYRFDGVRAVPWQPAGGEHLPSNTISALLAGRDGTLWIGTLKGLASWKDGKLITYPALAGLRIFPGALIQDRQGTVWTGATALPARGKLCAIRAGAIQCYGEGGSLGFGVTGLYEDKQGNLWVGGLNGFWRWKTGFPEFFPMAGEIDGVRGFDEDDQGRLLIASNTGLKCLVGGKVQSYQRSGAVAQRFKVQAMHRDRDGGLWVGTLDRGLLHIRDGKIDTFSQTDGLSGDLVTSMLEDREGNIWVATSDGLDRFRGYVVPNISVRQGLSNSTTGSVLAARDGSVWIGTIKALNRWKEGRISVLGGRGGSQKSDGKLNGLPPNSLFQDSSGRIWVSTNREFGYLQNEEFVPVKGFPGGFVHAIVEAPPGHLWVASQQAGLIHLFGETIVQVIPWSEIKDTDFAFTAVPDQSGRGLWLGFLQGGVAYFADGAIRKSYSITDGLGGGIVNHIRFGERGVLWVATEGGLSRIEDGHVTTLSSKNGLPCEGVHWTIEDDDHNVWIYTPCGLVRISRTELEGWVADATRVVKATPFDNSDGVRSHQYAGGFIPRVSKSADGKIWFITFDGVSVIDPRHVASNKVPPPVHIEQVIADEKPYDVRNGMRLPARVHYLTIGYTALSLVMPEKVRFRIKLEGLDKDWRELSDRRVEYTNLPPKHYKFRLLACNNSGVWNEEGASLDFVIPPAWYQTNWFRAACIAAFLGTVWGIHELRVRQLAHQFNMRLEERVAERTRIARDLHDTLLQSFQGLLPLLQAGINMFGSRPADALRTFEKAADHASQAIAEGRDAIQGMRMSTVERNDLAVAIRTLGEELASAAKPPSPNFNVVVEGTSRNLHPILRDEVYRLTTEALRNAFRHAEAQNVEVEIRYDEKYFRLRIRDDGKGIPSDVLSGDGREGHYGLPGMRERAKLIGGKLTIWTEVDGGTEIEINIPGARAFVKSARPFWRFGKRSATETDEKEPIERE